MTKALHINNWSIPLYQLPIWILYKFILKWKRDKQENDTKSQRKIKSNSDQQGWQQIKVGIEETTDLHITNNINMMTEERKHRSRSTLHPKHFCSRFFLFWFVMAPHQPHLNMDAPDGSITRSPQPQQVVS